MSKAWTGMIWLAAIAPADVVFMNARRDIELFFIISLLQFDHLNEFSSLPNEKIFLRSLPAPLKLAEPG
jgi:hypothetical protein